MSLWDALTSRQFDASDVVRDVPRKLVYDLAIELARVAQQREIDRIALVRIAGQMRRAAGFR